MPLKLLPQKDFIISEYQTKTCQQIADENGWYHQAVANLLKTYNHYSSYLPNQGNIRYFQDCNTSLKAYFLGFIAADGCLQCNGNTSKSVGLTITIHKSDICILEKLREEIGCENRIYDIKGKMTHDKTKEKNHCRFQLFNKELFNDLSSYGLTMRKSTTMSDIIKNIPPEFRKAFIIGYFDGDGSISYNKASNQFVLSFRGTQTFLQGIQDEIQFEKFRLIKDKQKNCFTLTIWRKSDIQKFANSFKELDFYLLRKYNKFPKYEN